MLKSLTRAKDEEEEGATMSPMLLEQELNLSRRACCHSDEELASCLPSAPPASSGVNRGLRIRPRGLSSTRASVKCVLLVLLGVLLISFPAPTAGRPNGTATAAVTSGWQDTVQDSQPNVSRRGVTTTTFHIIG